LYKFIIEAHSIKKGNELNARDKDGKTALSFVLKYKNKNLEGFLIKKGANNKMGIFNKSKIKYRGIFNI
ncbi:MAG: hypothetical protein GDA46_07070, partial [Bdellovibrionales bacterium]|nr:hypothetical protein [Bdellovibrionales bacterium]